MLLIIKTFKYMKNSIQISALIVFAMFQTSCKSTSEIAQKTATINVPSKSEIKLFDQVEHNSFSINLSNQSTKNSCEAYLIKNNSKKWISPSLLANKELDFSVAKNAYVLLENFSDENITVTYSIN